MDRSPGFRPVALVRRCEGWCARRLVASGYDRIRYQSSAPLYATPKTAPTQGGRWWSLTLSSLSISFWRRDALPDSLTSADQTRSPSLSRPIARRGRGVARQGRQAVGVDMPTIPAGPARAPRGRSARRTGRVPQLPGSRNPCSRGTYDRSGPAGCVEDLEKSGSGGPENDGRIRRIARDIERVEHRLAASPRRVAGPRSALSPLVAGITAGSATVAPRARWLS